MYKYTWQTNGPDFWSFPESHVKDAKWGTFSDVQTAFIYGSQEKLKTRAVIYFENKHILEN